MAEIYQTTIPHTTESVSIQGSTRRHRDFFQDKKLTKVAG